MDHGLNESEPIKSGSFGHISSTNSSFRRRSFNRYGSSHHEIDDDSVSEAGDIGERALSSRRYSESGRSRFSFDNPLETAGLPIQEHSFKESQLPTASPTSPDAILLGKDQDDECKKELPWYLTYISSRVHLAVLGILGVLTRYLLEKLFGPKVVGATGDHSYMYIDLPPNMVGSFFMGWFGAVFKADISNFSPELAVGLTTGYLGSLTTFSGWNQKMLELSVDGQWVFAILGFLLGLFLVAYSFIFGVETAKGLKWALNRTKLSSKCGLSPINGVTTQIILIIVMATMLGVLWGVSVTMLKKDFDGDSSTSHLWFGCIVGPVGVWIRFYLARFNGQGLGKAQILKWMPFGTLMANVAAACIMAAFATMKKSVNDKHFDTVATGIQFGFCGCLSTVSTFIAEFEAMRASAYPWRAYVYTFMTMIISFALGTLIFSVPVWTEAWS
ncbi:putative fluoride ion transporter CrcB [Helianthus annuus]|uniref:Fluoride ion transporter CrcB n=1 Tax=Helianthus annuus TaxID=4232 RepID=A0A251RLM1_HELAN|nr:fluoride export protein 1 isoform X1 [Helianthus annuus]KAF5753758.1 putative fluoride ion transporter CrcB [Helianthus annuus]KAJ0427780.1 putative fluoride ion transporter CrcB [Helianthus annuus]KAJ0446069.1 putative fluoride ion transporter CrcB [Helianthus annuus]